MFPMYFSSDEVELLEDVSATTAQRRLAAIRAHFGIKKYEKVSIVQYAKFRKLKVKFVISMLEMKVNALRKHQS